ncbi:hypothetical protein BBP40_002602 [Aspergillus hancockii]|nr:hypothetical protein BBP40_002602 [Aspergillus hancockii]
MEDQLFIPETMTACIGVDHGHDDEGPHTVPRMSCVTMGAPRISSSKYLIRVHAFHISPYEHAYYQATAPQSLAGLVPGLNFCGSVVATPTKDHWNPHGPKFKVGDEVIGIVRVGEKGAAADYVLADGENIALKPTDITSIRAAALPTPILLAWATFLRLKELWDNMSPADRPFKVTVSMEQGYNLSDYINAIPGAFSRLGTNQFQLSWTNDVRTHGTGMRTVKVPVTSAVVTLFPRDMINSAEHIEREVIIDLVPSTSQVWKEVFLPDKKNASHSGIEKAGLQAILDTFSELSVNTVPRFDEFELSELPSMWDKDHESDRGWVVGITEIMQESEC